MRAFRQSWYLKGNGGQKKDLSAVIILHNIHYANIDYGNLRNPGVFLKPYRKGFLWQSLFRYVKHGTWDRFGRSSMSGRIDRVEFVTCRLLGGLTREETAKMIGVTRRTIENWEHGRVRIPYAAFWLLRLRTGAALPYPGWQDWTCRAGVLCSPAGQTFTAGELQYLSLVFAMAREWQKLPPAEQSRPVDPARPVDLICTASSSLGRSPQPERGRQPRSAARSAA